MPIQTTPEDSIKITDWITALAAAFGVPLSLVALYKLVARDKDRENQIDKLANISEQLGEQVKHLSAQTAEFQHQSTLMIEHNNLLERQIQLQEDAYLKSNGIEEKKLAFEHHKRIMEIRPYFIYRQDSLNGIRFYVTLSNKGNTANNISACLVQFGGVKSVNVERESSDRNSTISLNMELSTATEYIHLSFQIELKFTDIDGNDYIQYIKLLRGNYIATIPKLITNS